MTDDVKLTVGRRPVVAGTIALIGVAIAGAAYELPRLFRHRYPQTPYDDLLTRLGDRDNAARLGAAVLRDDATFDAQATAQMLRSEFGQKDLAAIVQADLARDRMSETQGWILPKSLAEFCALAAKAG